MPCEVCANYNAGSCPPCPEGGDHCQATCECPYCDWCWFMCHCLEEVQEPEDIQVQGGHVEAMEQVEPEEAPEEDDVPALEEDEGETETVILTPSTNKTISSKL